MNWSRTRGKTSYKPLQRETSFHVTTKKRNTTDKLYTAMKPENQIFNEYNAKEADTRIPKSHNQNGTGITIDAIVQLHNYKQII